MNSFALTCRKVIFALAATFMAVGNGYAADAFGNIMLATTNPVSVVDSNPVGKKYITVKQGTYNVGNGWTLSSVQVYVVPQAGGAAGEDAAASYIQGTVWAGEALGLPADMLFKNGGAGFPIGKYNVYAKGKFTKNAATSYGFTETVVVEVK